MATAKRTWEERQKYIGKLEQLDLEISTIDEISALISEIIKGLKVEVFVLPVEAELFRAIRWDNKPNTWENIIYPPTEKAKLNRASLAGESMFYCATKKRLAFHEIEAKIGDRIAVSNWITSKKLSLQNIGYSNEDLVILNLRYYNTPHFRYQKARLLS